MVFSYLLRILCYLPRTRRILRTTKAPGSADGSVCALYAATAAAITATSCPSSDTPAGSDPATGAEAPPAKTPDYFISSSSFL